MLKIDRKFVDAVSSAVAPADLFPLIEQAIALEHSTIPPYLSAYLSLKNDARYEAVGIIFREIFVDEMLHMALMANLLNALGGKPTFADPNFIPKYPSSLPMGIAGDLVVSLGACSIPRIRDVFMNIEAPKEPISITAGAADETYVTIGEFYAALSLKIGELDDDDFQGEGRNPQVIGNGYFNGKLTAIGSIKEAQAAIDMIAEEGEGRPDTPFANDGDPAHYYRFEQIVYGKKLLPDTSTPSGYSYSGDPIAIDADQVWDMEENVSLATYAVGSEARAALKDFMVSYSDVLRSLQDCFNGDPSKLDEAVGLMYTMTGLADKVLQLPSPNIQGKQVGLAFSYIPDQNSLEDENSSGQVEEGDVSMTSFRDVVDLLDALVDDENIGAHGSFWKGMSREDFVEGQVFGQRLVEIGNPADSGIVRALRGLSPFGADLSPRPARARYRRMPAGMPPATEAQIQIVESWIADGCLEVESGPISMTASASAADDETHNKFWKDFDDFFLFNRSPETTAHENQIMGESAGLWFNYAVGDIDIADWLNHIQSSQYQRSAEYVAVHQIRVMEHVYGSPLPQDDILESYWKFGGNLLPDNPMRPQRVRHTMDGTRSWWNWIPQLDGLLRLDPGNEMNDMFARGWHLGYVADGLLRDDADRPPHDRVKIGDFDPNDPDVFSMVKEKYLGLDSIGLSDEFKRRVQENM